MLHPQFWSYARYYGRPYRAAFPHRTWRRATKRREVFLSFDDGPLPGGTDVILDILAAESVQATFFCVGRNVLDHPALFERIRSEGHAWGNHGFEHRSGWGTPSEPYLAGVHRCQELLPARTRGRPLFRPPFGKLTPQQSQLVRRDFEIVMWDIMTGDFDQSTNPQCVDSLIERKARPGSILLLHDDAMSVAKNRILLPRVIARLRELRFCFATL